MTKITECCNYFCTWILLGLLDDGGSAPVLLPKARCDFLRLVLGLLGQFSCCGPEALHVFQ